MKSELLEESDQRISEAIVVVDVCKHSELIERLGEQGWMSIANVLNSIVKEASAPYRCQHLSNTGDGYLATFSTPQEALSAVFSILSRTKSYNEVAEERKRLFLRCSANYGEIIVGPSGERLGERVNETFRIDALRQEVTPTK